MDFDELFPNRFLKAGQFQGRDVTLTIAGIKLEELEGDKGKETKAILSFEKTPKQLVLNKTNATCIKAMFGRQTDEWIGKRVTFFPKDEAFGDTEMCIRVRGSPDISALIRLDTKIGRRKLKATLVPTGKGKERPPAKAMPDHDPETGEVFEELPAEAEDASAPL